MSTDVSRSMIRRVLAPMLATTVLALTVAAGTTAQSPSAAPSAAAGPAPTLAPFPATISDPTADAASHAEWAQAWWTWLLTPSAADDPSLASTCTASPADGPQFLPQTWFGTTQMLTCTVTADRGVLVSAGGSLCTADPGDTDADVVTCNMENQATLYGPSITVDGRLLPDINAHLGYTEPFDMALPADNAFGPDAATHRAVASGWFVLLTDLAPGTHTIAVRDQTIDPVTGPTVAESITTLEVTE